jgi:hypothetical protein
MRGKNKKMEKYLRLHIEQGAGEGKSVENDGERFRNNQAGSIHTVGFLTPSAKSYAL